MGLDIHLYKVIDPSLLSKEDLDHDYLYERISYNDSPRLELFKDKVINFDTEYYDFEKIEKFLGISFDEDVCGWGLGIYVEFVLKEGVSINPDLSEQPFISMDIKEFLENINTDESTFDYTKLQFYVIDSSVIYHYGNRVFVENCPTFIKNEPFLICKEIGYQRKGQNYNFGTAVREERLEAYVTTLDDLLKDAKEYFTHTDKDHNLNGLFKENMVAGFVEGETFVQYNY